MYRRKIQRVYGVGGGKADAVVFDNVDVFCVTSCRVEW